VPGDSAQALQQVSSHEEPSLILTPPGGTVVPRANYLDPCAGRMGSTPRGLISTHQSDHAPNFSSAPRASRYTLRDRGSVLMSVIKRTTSLPDPGHRQGALRWLLRRFFPFLIKMSTDPSVAVPGVLTRVLLLRFRLSRSLPAPSPAAHSPRGLSSSYL
jgi:hypothetical protein